MKHHNFTRSLKHVESRATTVTRQLLSVVAKSGMCGRANKQWELKARAIAGQLPLSKYIALGINETWSLFVILPGAINQWLEGKSSNSFWSG